MVRTVSLTKSCIEIKSDLVTSDDIKTALLVLINSVLCMECGNIRRLGDARMCQSHELV